MPTTDTTDAELADYESCQTAASAGACAASAAAVGTSCASETADATPGPGSVCFAAVNTLGMVGTTPAQALHALQVLFGSVCAPSLLDGG